MGEVKSNGENDLILFDPIQLVWRAAKLVVRFVDFLNSALVSFVFLCR